MKDLYQIILELISIKKSDKKSELSQLHLVEKMINHVGIKVSASLKARDTLYGKILLHKDEYNLGRKCIWNFRAAVGMLSYL